MASQRKAIRSAIVALLVSAGTSAGANVFPTRTVPYTALNLTAISVYTLEDNVEDSSASTSPRELTRRLSVVIEGWVDPGSSVDDAMDDFADEIEVAMHADRYLGGACADSILTSTVMESIEESDRELGWIALTYDVKYYTDAPAAVVDDDMDDFVTAHATYKISDDANDAEDSVTVLEE